MNDGGDDEADDLTMYGAAVICLLRLLQKQRILKNRRDGEIPNAGVVIAPLLWWFADLGEVTDHHPWIPVILEIAEEEGIDLETPLPKKGHLRK